MTSNAGSSVIRFRAVADSGIDAFTVEPSAYGMQIACAIGPRPSFSRLIIRYRTDGVTPSRPDDGLLLLDAPALAGTTFRGWHHPLYRGFTYRYKVFGLDARGSVRASATAYAAPAAG
jgi:hypothetical protein